MCKSNKTAPLDCTQRTGSPKANEGEPQRSSCARFQANDVAVVVQPDRQGTFGEGVDGLLGMSFLSRFKVTIDAQAVKISNRKDK